MHTQNNIQNCLFIQIAILNGMKPSDIWDTAKMTEVNSLFKRNSDGRKMKNYRMQKPSKTKEIWIIICICLSVKDKTHIFPYSHKQTWKEKNQPIKTQISWTMNIANGFVEEDAMFNEKKGEKITIQIKNHHRFLLGCEKRRKMYHILALFVHLFEHKERRQRDKTQNSPNRHTYSIFWLMKQCQTNFRN